MCQYRGLYNKYLGFPKVTFVVPSFGFFTDGNITAFQKEPTNSFAGMTNEVFHEVTLVLEVFLISTSIW